MAFTRLGDMPIGSIVKTPINGVVREFIVIQHGQPAGYDHSWATASILLLKEPYENRAWGDKKFYSYNDSTIHPYLNGEFINSLDASIRGKLQTVLIRFGGKAFNIPNSYIGGSALAKVFLLGYNEVGLPSDSNVATTGVLLSYFEYGNTASANIKRTTYLNGFNTFWWLRDFRKSPTADKDPISSVTSVNDYGSSAATEYVYGIAVRPALSFSSDVWVDSNGLLDAVGNTPPTAPGSITYDTPRAGKSLTITLTPATDPD